MFQPADGEYRRSYFGKEGGHYNIYALKPAGESADLAFLRLIFPTGEANDLNFLLFSTSGIHGSYTTLEEVESSLLKYGPNEPPGDEWPEDYAPPRVTVLLVQPRIVSMTCGNVAVTLENLPFLKRLRESSWAVIQTIGAPPRPSDSREGA